MEILGILEADTSGDKGKNRKRISQDHEESTRNQRIQQKSYQKDKHLSSSPHLRYSRPFLKWTMEELQQMNQRARKLMTMQKASQRWRKTDSTRQEKKGGRELSSIEDNVHASIQRLEDDIKNPAEDWLQQPETIQKTTSISRIKIIRKLKWQRKNFYDHFKWQTSKISVEKTWTWLRKGNLKKEIESLMIAQNNTIITMSKQEYDKIPKIVNVGFVVTETETINQIISECSKLTQKAYKNRHKLVRKVIHWNCLRSLNLTRRTSWYMHNP